MINKIDRRLVPIFRNVKETRALLPHDSGTGDQLYQLYIRWIKEALDQIETILRNIDTERVLVVKKARKPTEDIFDKKLREAIGYVQGSNGILYSVDQIFGEPAKHSAKVLDQMRKIRANALTIRRQIKCMTSWLCSFFHSWKPIVVLFLIAFVFIVAVSFHSAEKGKPPVQAVAERFQKDAQQLHGAAANATGLERVAKVATELKEIGQLVPAILVAIASALTAVKGISTGVQALKRKS
jgi:hypothetical protein